MREPTNAGDPNIKHHNSILITGPVGSGKTTLYRTIPGRKFVYLFDPNAEDAIRGSDDIDYLLFTPEVEDVELAVKSLKAGVGDQGRRRREPKTYWEWERDWEERYENKFFDKYDWIGFDSLTTLSEAVMDRVQYLNNRLGKHPQQDDYTAEMTTVRNIVRATTALTNVFVTVHTETQKDDLTGRIEGQLVLTGKNRIRVPLRFAHILGTKSDRNSKNEVRYYMVTKPERMYPNCRTSIKGIDPQIDVTLDWEKDLTQQGIGQWILKGTS